ncbi:MAG: VWA domain-containing protein [Flavobacteriales bacterium]|jgi:Ca-activated chloride channel family protein|nr:VWA domain-containing protein [Flavobacteriales bacterium]
MEFNHFHFENGLWFLGLLFIPLVWLLHYFFNNRGATTSRLESFIDKELLPHLLINKVEKRYWKSLLLWSSLWTLLIVALAGPLWRYRDLDTFIPDQSLCILLDVSKSMDADDVKPSRLIRARQKIEDILNLSQGVKIGLIAFAADPHMITPLTDDRETTRHFLSSIGTDLVYVQGSRLSPALIMASHLLTSAPGHNKSILVISDGGFEDSDAIATTRKLAQDGLKIHTLGMGTEEGAPMKDSNGNFIKKNGEIVLSKLEKNKLKEISQAGNGQYFDTHYSDEDIQALLNQIKEKVNSEEKTQQKIRHWEDDFYLFVFPAMALLLLWFRRGFIFPLFLLWISFNIQETQATSFHDFFQNEDQLGKEALERGDYEMATEKFKDSYRQGVAQYKAGHFYEAEKLFRGTQRPEVAMDALYNLGNALAQQQKVEEAIGAYEMVLQKNPSHAKAKHNLEILKAMLEQQKKQKEKEQEKEDQDKKAENKDQKGKDDSSSDEKQKQDNKENQGKDSSQNNDSSQKKSKENKDTGQNQSSKENEQKTGDEKEKKESKEFNDEYKNDQNPSDTPGKENQGDSQHKKGDEKLDKQQKPQIQSSQQRNLSKNQEDADADQWLDQIKNDPKSFLKNQFYMESQQNGSQEGIEPW